MKRKKHGKNSLVSDATTTLRGTTLFETLDATEDWLGFCRGVS